MDGEEFESSSDQSTDEELCQQLRDAGLKLVRTRRKSFRESKKRSKHDFNQSLDLNTLDITNAPFFEKVGEHFMELDTCTLVPSNRGFDESIQIDVECTSSRDKFGEPSSAMSPSQTTSSTIMTPSDVHDHGDLVNQNGEGLIELLAVDQISSATGCANISLALNEDLAEMVQIDVVSESVIQDTNITDSTTTSSRDNVGQPKVVILSEREI